MTLPLAANTDTQMTLFDLNDKADGQSVQAKMPEKNTDARDSAATVADEPTHLRGVPYSQYRHARLRECELEIENEQPKTG